MQYRNKPVINILVFVFCLGLAFSGCVGTAFQPAAKRYTATYLTLFDTVTQITGFAESEEAFDRIARGIHDELLEYHRLFDIYNGYEGINNLKTLNDSAGKGPILVDGKIIALLQDCKEYHALTDGRTNVAMGSVLQLWHGAREDSLRDLANAHLPDPDVLSLAGAHMDLSNVIIDAEASMVTIADPDLQLDVGAVAKGWAVQQVAKKYSAHSLLISVGGNIVATAPKDANGTPWNVGIQDPRSDGYLSSLSLTRGAMVTSGDYQRYFEVDGKRYHHIIDPETGYPSHYWSSVTIVCEDSGLADALSTALFLLPLEEGLEILDACDGMAMWVDPEGKIFYSPGFEDMIQTTE